MTPKILVEEGTRSRLVELTANPRITIGRAPTNGVVIEDTAASREHCALERRGDRWFVKDLESKNGTRLNGATIASALRLEPGDRIEIGQARITFLDAQSEPGLEESSGLSSFARSLGPNEPRPSTEERVAPPFRTPVDQAADAIFAAIGEGKSLTEVLDAIEREVLARALADANGNRSEAARRLQLSRPGMLKKMKRYGIG